jgi:hypothetical protein
MSMLKNVEWLRSCMGEISVCYKRYRRDYRRESLRVARAYKRESRKNRFGLGTLFERRFCLSSLKVVSLGSGKQIGEDRIELKK